MGRSIPPLQQLPHGLIENRIAPQRQHITHGKHITHDNQHINKQHEHQPIGEAMTNHHAEDGDKKSILDARIERAYANEYDAAFAAATIKNYASLPLATILADHPQLLKRCTKIMGDPDIRKLTDPYAPKRDNDSYVLTVGCLAHMLTALDTKLKLEWEPDERHELESKRNTLRTALFLPLDGLKRCNVELNTQARQKPGTTGQKTSRPHAVDRNRYNRMTAHFSAEGAAIRTLIDLLCLLSINELFEGYLALVPATAPKSVAKIIETCGDSFFVWSGNDDEAVTAMALGAKGLISVLSNVRPKKTLAMLRACQKNDFRTAGRLQRELMELIGALFCEVNPIPVKKALELEGFPVGLPRLPLTELTEEKLPMVKAALAATPDA